MGGARLDPLCFRQDQLGSAGPERAHGRELSKRSGSRPATMRLLGKLASALARGHPCDVRRTKLPVLRAAPAPYLRRPKRITALALPVSTRRALGHRAFP